MSTTSMVDKMRVTAYASNAAAGAAAAGDLAQILQTAVEERGEAAVILATGNSQLSFIKALGGLTAVPWNKISVFHMDEYIGIPEDHPASFRRYMREKLVQAAHPKTFFGIKGDAPDLEQEMERYSALLREHRPVACVMGIGENGHLAFNDPPVDFHTERDLAIVTLDAASRRQQVGEGHFARVDDVPQHAITLTIPALLTPPHVLVVVPEGRKAAAVQKALEGPVTPACPASILRTCSHATVYLDQESASFLQRGEGYGQGQHAL